MAFLKLATLLTLLAASAFAQDPCAGKGNLAARWNLNVAVNDADGDGVVTGQEIENDFVANYDKDADGCVTRQEWVNRWEEVLFSAGYANARFDSLGVNDTNNPCPIDVKGFAGAAIPIAGFLDGNVQTLIDLCEGDNSLYQSNCDCVQLKDTCTNDAFFKTVNACVKYVSSQSGTR